MIFVRCYSPENYMLHPKKEVWFRWFCFSTVVIFRFSFPSVFPKEKPRWRSSEKKQLMTWIMKSCLDKVSWFFISNGFWSYSTWCSSNRNLQCVMIPAAWRYTPNRLTSDHVLGVSDIVMGQALPKIVQLGAEFLKKQKLNTKINSL